MANLQYFNEDGVEYFTFTIPDFKEEIRKEMDFLQYFFQFSKDQGGGQNADGSAKNANNVMFIEDIFAPPLYQFTRVYQETAKVLQELNEYCATHLEAKHSAMADLGNGFHWKTLLSGYKDGGKYDLHRDSAIASCVWWVGDNYQGGNIYFPDLELEFESKEFTGIVFPSFYRHIVRDIKSEEKDKFIRYTISGFLNYFYE